MTATLFSGAGGGAGADAFGLQHCESAPAGLFQDELRQLRKLGLTETLGMVRALLSNSTSVSQCTEVISMHAFLMADPVPCLHVHACISSALTRFPA